MMTPEGMTPEDFGLTAARLQAAINGSDEACDVVLAQMMRSERFDELLVRMKAHRPHVYLRVMALLRGETPPAESKVSH